MSNVIWVDENDNVLGEITREKAHQEGLLHRVAVIYLVNDKGDILVNERAKDGHFDHSSAGHVDVGENYFEAAKRELEEELGVVDVELQNIGSSCAQDKNKMFNSRHIFRVYVCKANPVKLKKDEVKSVYWANPKKIYEDMKINPQNYTGGFKSTLRLFLSTKL
ncbi:NUDIX domain-containing protein [Patescibacteria group bacterium]|nr:NUDIX domain-containing protein [Patescibacteria group bacterium]